MGSLRKEIKDTLERVDDVIIDIATAYYPPTEWDDTVDDMRKHATLDRICRMISTPNQKDAYSLAKSAILIYHKDDSCVGRICAAYGENRGIDPIERETAETDLRVYHKSIHHDLLLLERYQTELRSTKRSRHSFRRDPEIAKLTIETMIERGESLSRAIDDERVHSRFDGMLRSLQRQKKKVLDHIALNAFFDHDRQRIVTFKGVYQTNVH